MKRLSLTTAFVLAAGLFVHAQQTKSEQMPAPSIAGKWTLTVETQSGSLPSELNVKLDGKKVTGTLASQMGESQISGEYADGRLSFAMTFDAGGNSGQVSFVGNLKADGTFAGTMDFNNQGMNLPWKAQRSATAEAPQQQDPPKKDDAEKPADVAGKWTMTMDMAIGQATPALVFKQDGDKITGTYTGRYGTFPFKGTMKGREIQFSFQMDTDGGQTTMSFTGEVASDTQTMKGSGSIDGLGDVTWTAKRDKS